MQSIIEIFQLSDPKEDSEVIVNFIDGEVHRCKLNGDYLGAGEWLISKLSYVKEADAEAIYSQIISLWASPHEPKTIPESIDDLIDKFHEYVPEVLATAFIKATMRYNKIFYSLPDGTVDLAFRLKEQIEKIYNFKEARFNQELHKIAAQKLKHSLNSIFLYIKAFEKTNCSTAKNASIEVIKNLNILKAMVLAEEKPILSSIKILLGSSFRKFCEFYERGKINEIIKRSSDLREHAKKYLSPNIHTYENSTLWRLTVEKIAKHIVKLVNEGVAKSKELTTPNLKLNGNNFKIDLSRKNIETNLSCRLQNNGEGVAYDVRLLPDSLHSNIELVSDKNKFSIEDKSERSISFRIILREHFESLLIPIKIMCSTIDERELIYNDRLVIEQQNEQPNWDELIKDPPYNINPIKDHKKLFGRETILNNLILHAYSGTSTFIWGQKRVGKTSVIQVLAKELQNKKNFICITFRMGELGALHEGQIGHCIAKRISENLPDRSLTIPEEKDFGANINRLVPFIETVINQFSDLKFVVIIDEFDDLEPAFYTGERGKLFVKALRSLSEIGLTFFFVGSERMATIYNKHANDLNKWLNLYLDRIDSRDDCKTLIIKQVEGAIEYQKECVDTILDYCSRNPFYIHLLCFEIFKLCYSEQRTYVGDNDLDAIKQNLLRSLGLTNFSHFWEDNPILEPEKNIEHTAENCLVLSCISYLGGGFKSVDEVFKVQDNIGISITDRISKKEVEKVVHNLISRKVIEFSKTKKEKLICLPIFRDWLSLHAELQVLPKWKQFRETKKEELSRHPEITSVTESFPISEDDLLPIAQQLKYCGKQKDVSEIRAWLRQFDDEVRIDTAFLLLKRLSEKGFITEGAKKHQLNSIEEGLQAKRKKLDKGIWKIYRDKKFNLCITYTDNDIKSGATTARDLHKRLRPSKVGPSNSIYEWMKSRINDDPIVLIVDDFAGTGNTLIKGLNSFLNNPEYSDVLKRYLKERRIFLWSIVYIPQSPRCTKRKFYRS